MIGKIVSHYKILEKLGQGGMGVVYKAQDTKLDRFVALKFLPPHFSVDEEEQKRFIQEAKAASALQHNNICTIHEINEANDSQLFICIDYYEGDTLKDKIAQGPLEKKEAIDYIIQIAQGLAKAHEKDIIHRDIKPANIIITNDGVVKILDFGLAKLAGQTRLTKSGSTLGTVAYMSPEQTQGENVDHRTDIWSLGVVFYEMLTGQLPFKGDYEQAIMYSILNEEPESISNYSDDFQDQLQKILDYAISKKPVDRYKTADEVLTDLNALGSQTEQNKTSQFIRRRKIKRLVKKPLFYIPVLLLVIILLGFFNASNYLFTKPPLRIAVLPFETKEGMSDVEKEEINGIWIEIINDLEKLKQIQPLNRDFVRMFKSSEYYAQLKDKYQIDFVISTICEKLFDRYQVTAIPLDLKDSTEKTNIKFASNLLGFKQEYLTQISTSLDITIDEKEELEIQKEPTQDPIALSFYNRGVTASANLPPNPDLAIKLYNKALEIDPTFDLAYAAKSLAYIMKFEFSGDDSFLDKSLIAAQDAILNNKDLALGYACRGFVYLFRGEIYDSYTDAIKALSLDASDKIARLVLIHVYQFTGFSEKALKICNEALEDDPHFWAIGMKKMYSLCKLDRIKEGHEVINEFLDYYPDHPYLLIWSVWSNIVNNHLDGAKISFEKLKPFQQLPWVKLVEVLLLAAEQKSQEAQNLLTSDLFKYAEESMLGAWFMVRIYAQLNDIDSAIEWLNKQIRFGWEEYDWLQIDPLLDNMRDDPRFQEILKVLKKNWETHKKQLK